MNQSWNELSDIEVVELSKKNPDAFEILVLRYQKRLFFYIKRISFFSNEDIEDIIQDVFIKVYRYLNEFDNTFAFSTWIYRITRNTTIDEIRKKNSRPQSADLEDEELVKIFRSDQDVEKEMERKDDFEKAKKIIHELPFKYREVLILKLLEDKSYEEMVDILRKPKGTVAALVSRGRKILAKQMQKQGLSIK